MPELPRRLPRLLARVLGARREGMGASIDPRILLACRRGSGPSLAIPAFPGRACALGGRAPAPVGRGGRCGRRRTYT
eukprot:scaffold49574_cov39-Phaeocystis_antarctica.AAC.1